MTSKIRQRINSRRAAKAEGFAAAIKNGKVLFRNKEEYIQYLIENGARPYEARSIVHAQKKRQTND